ncbi:site-2 protease family protein [Streptomyces sp. NBC_01136]|uniref:site-2 protease family protein n=1 Tax=unclassified Streptomyces TaxID=2593676 RepID=UPI00324F0B97|nr:site-2 protease family protein [Streptomyces sp. NBC_01136]
MDESGGSGQPRSGTDEATERHGEPGAPSAPAADATRPGPERPEHPTGPTPTEPGPPEADPSPDGTREAEPHASSPSEPETPSGASDEAGSETSGQGATDSSDRPRSGASGEAQAGSGSQDAPPVHPDPPAGAHTDPAPASDAARGADDQPTGTGTPAHPRTLAHSATGTGKTKPPRRGREPGGGLLMGRPFGVPVYVAPSWFLVAALITWVFGGQLDRVLPELGALRYLVSLFFAVAFYASVLVHELAHTVAALRFKLPVRRIQLQFFGGVSEIEKEAETPGREFVLAFVGPLLSLVLSGLFLLAMQAVEPGTVPGVLLAGLMISNLIVAAFNLLPGLPLDGGRMLRAVVWKITGKPMSGTIAAAWVGRALAVSVLIGLPLLTQSGALGQTQDNGSGMDTVTDALLAAILAAIIWTGAGNSLRMARLREHLPELRARSLTRRAVPVETNTPLSEALRRANEAGARALVVVDANGEPLSLVREAAIVGVPEHRRPWVAVSGLAQDLTDGMRVSAELAGEDLLDVLRATPATEYLVVEDSGEIYGVLSAADVERAFVKAMARPS